MKFEKSNIRCIKNETLDDLAFVGMNSMNKLLLAPNYVGYTDKCIAKSRCKRDLSFNQFKIFDERTFLHETNY